jgi:galactose mutarotase-like enzyme
MSGYPFTLGLTIDYELSDAGLRVRAARREPRLAGVPYGVGLSPLPLTIGGS